MDPCLAIEDEDVNNISKLPQEPSWEVSDNFYKYQQFWYYSFTLKGIILLQKNFIPQPNHNIILSTPPKSGTTWLKALAFAIHTRTQYINGDSDSDSDSPLLSNFPHDLIPCTEILYSFGENRDPQGPLFHTHIPFTSLPKSILNSNAKIIYLCRNPKDVLVSEFLYTSKFPDAEIISFQEAYEKFCNGFSHCGPFWDHVLGYWKASLEFPERVLFLKYEDLKKDTCFYVKKMADFMGCGFSIDEEQKGIVERIVQLCSFENLSNLDVNKRTSRKDPRYKLGNATYFRKGKIGEWKNYLTPEMAERIDQITNKKFSGYGLQM